MGNQMSAGRGWLRSGFAWVLAFVLTCSGIPAQAMDEVLADQSTQEETSQEDASQTVELVEGLDGEEGTATAEANEGSPEEDAIELETQDAASGAEQLEMTDDALEVVSQSDNDTSGRCGENLTWELDVNGVLTVRGQGDMYDFFHGDPDRYPPFPTNKVKKVIVEEGVTSIGDIAFAWCDLVEEVQLPDTITRIGDGAFASKSKLTSIRLPANLTDIGANAFIYCTNLSGITIPTGVTRIGSQAFYQCRSLTSIEIPDGVTSIGDRAFCDCSKLVAVFIPPSVTSFGEEVFNGTPWMAAQGDFVIVNGVLLRYKGPHDWNTVEIPDEVTIIGKRAFYDLGGSWNVTIPDGVTAIQNSAFARCGLQSVAIPGSVKSIGWNAFYRCAIKTATIGEGLTTIVEGAFFEAEEIQSVSLPSTVKTIGADAFNGCYCLTSCNLPEGLETIGNKAFAGCKLKEVTIPSTLVTLGWGAFSGNSMKSVTIPANITSIGKQTFSYCRNLETVELHEGIDIIRESTFEYSGLTSIDLPESVKTIEKSAFEYCTKLASIDFPSTLTTIGEAAFRNCSALESVELPEGITSAGDSVFASSGLTRISLPSSLKSVPGRICEDCSKLAEVTFAQGITEVRGTGFKNCGSLTSVTIPEGVKIIGDYCFAGCGNLTDVSLPSTLTRIDYEAFSGCSKLTSIVLPAGLTSLGGAVFYNCSALTDITLPSTLTYIGWNEFKGCKSLVDVVIPEGVTTIDYGAFHNCTNLETLAIPESVTEMWNPVQKTDKLVLYVVPGSYAEDWAIENDFPFEYRAMSGSNLVAKVCGPDGAELTQGYTVYWYSEEGEALGTGNVLRKTTEGTRYRCVVLLDEGLGRRYVQPSDQLVTATSQAETVSFVLEEFARATVRGTVRTKGGEAIARASVKLKQTFNGQYVTASTVEADDKGEFLFDAFRTNSILIASADGYYDGYYSVSFDAEGDDASVDVVLEAVPSNRITLSLYRQEAALPGETGEVVQLSNANGLTFLAFNETRGEDIADVRVQYPYITLGEGMADSGDTIRLSAIDQTGATTADDVVVTLDDARCAEVDWTMLQNGSIRLRDIAGGERNTVMVFDSTGRCVDEKSVSSSYSSGPLAQGDYSCVLLQQAKSLRNIDTLSRLADLGLVEGTDYVRVDASVRNGVVCVVSDVQVPAMGQSPVNYTVDEGTYLLSAKNETTTGQYVTMRASYEIAEKYQSTDTDETVTLELPEGMVLVERSLTVNGKTHTCVVASRDGAQTVTVPVNERKGTLRFHVLAATSGSKSVYAYLSFRYGEATAMQALGSTSVEVTAASIKVPANTGSKTVTASGKAIAGCEITVYDNGTLVGSTKSKKNGSWSLEFELVNPRKYSAHEVYASVKSADYGVDIETDVAEVFYNCNYVEVSKVTMINTAHPSGSLAPVEFKTVFDYLSPTTTVPSYNYWPSYPTFTFVVEFTQGSKDAIDNVLVATTDSSGNKTIVPCNYDEGSDAWIGTHEYRSISDVPCHVNVKYDGADAETFDCMLDDEDFAELQTVADDVEAVPQVNLEDTIKTVVESKESDSVSVNLESEGESLGSYKIELLDYEQFDLESWSTYEYHQYEYENAPSEYVRTEQNGSEYVTYVVCPDEKSYIKATFTLFVGDEQDSEGVSVQSIKPSDWKILFDSYDTWKKRYEGTKELLDTGFTLFGLTKDYLAIRDNGKILENDLASVDKLLHRDCACIDHSLDDFIYDGLKQQVDDCRNLWTKKVVMSGCVEALKLIGGKAILGKVTSYGGTVVFNINKKIWRYVQKAFGHSGRGRLKIRDKGLIKIISDAEVSFLVDGMSKWTKNALGWAAEQVGLDAGRIEWMLDTRDSVRTDFEKLRGQLSSTIRKLKDVKCPCYDKHGYCPCGDDGGEGDSGLPANPIADPSGYVYEAVPSNRVEGVKAQIYQYDYAVDEFGVPEDQKSEILWDAQSYDQVNPQYTGADGTFGWDVPEGQWVVKFSKDGYEDADSRRDVACDEEGYLPVPPIQTEVNAAIVSKSAPVVSGVRAYGDSVRIDFSQYMQIDSVSAAGTVVVTSGGKAVDGTVEPINAEDNYEGTAQYASSFWFRPASKLSGTVTVAVKGARNYNGVAMEAGYRGDCAVTQQPEGLEVSAPASVGHHNSAVVDVQVLPAKAGAGQTLSVASFSPSIVAPQVDEVVTDKNGRAQITLDGKLPGQGVLRVSLVGTDIEETFAVSVEASAPQAIDIADCQVALAESSFVYNGKEHKPVVTVTHDGTELVAGTDYEVAYANNVEAGTATVTVTGIGRYAGSQSVSFSIAKAGQVIKTSKASYGVAMGKTVKLGAANKSAGGGALSYKTSNAKVAKVSAKGVVTPVGVGSATITATAAAKGSYKATSKKVTVKVVQGIQAITAEDAECVTGKTVKLGAKTSGDGKLTYKTSNAKVATVSAKGVVAGKAAGTAEITITAAATKNWKKATKTVTVKVGKANPLTASAVKKVVSVKYNKSKAVTTAANVKVSKAQGTVSFANASTDATAKKFVVDAKTGKVTVPKATKKGKYAVVIAVTAAGNKSYLPATKTVSYTLQVK